MYEICIKEVKQRYYWTWTELRNYISFDADCRILRVTDGWEVVSDE